MEPKIVKQKRGLIMKISEKEINEIFGDTMPTAAAWHLIHALNTGRDYDETLRDELTDFQDDRVGLPPIVLRDVCLLFGATTPMAAKIIFLQQQGLPGPSSAPKDPPKMTRGKAWRRLREIANGRKGE